MTKAPKALNPDEALKVFLDERAKTAGLRRLIRKHEEDHALLMANLREQLAAQVQRQKDAGEAHDVAVAVDYEMNH